MNDAVSAAPMSLAAFASALPAALGAGPDAYRPLMLKLAAGEGSAFEALCREHCLESLDTLHRQLRELSGIRYPAPADATRRDVFIAKYREASRDGDGHGVWVCYPWSRTVVHLLDRDDYFDVITDRNRNKITRDELQKLRTKRVGVVGLSVGGEAAVTVAQEHLCGHIVLADFDTLDLSNLNRLGAGVQDLGVNKAVIVARRIAQIDPYIGVTVYPQGVTAETMHPFLDGLDLLLEECDGLPVKYAIRVEAQRRRLNVIYAADERGFLSVEPYGNVPELPIFHGRISAPPPPREAFATALEFMRALTQWLGGWDGISDRSRHSLEQIGRTTSGYPQLASEARFAAGQLGHVARRLLLGERVLAKATTLDLDQFFPGNG